MKLSDRIREKKGGLEPAKPSGSPAQSLKKEQESGATSAADEIETTLRENAMNALFRQMPYMQLPAFDTAAQELAFWDATVAKILYESVREHATRVSQNVQQKVKRELLDIIVGFGPIEALIRDPSVSEIMINGPDKIYVERKGKVVLSGVKFRGDEQAMQVIKKILAPLGRRCDASSPMVDARLPDGSRVNIVIPPLALNGSTITIRKFSKKPLTIEKLIDFGSLTLEMGAFLEACVLARLNMVVSGGTGSGKTTTLNAISGFVPDDERVITIEDSAELQLQQDHVVSLETRPANVEGKGEVSIRELVKNSLRMRPERIIIGECRAGETLDMLQAMNTGHDGSLTTGHANTPVDMVRRLETMVLMAGMNLPIRNIREQIASAVQLIVQQNRLHDGTRRITAIAEVRGMQGDRVEIANIFEWVQEGTGPDGKILGHHRATGVVPRFLPRLRDARPDLPDNLLGPGVSVEEKLRELDRERQAEEDAIARKAAERAAVQPEPEVSEAASLAGRAPFKYSDALPVELKKLEEEPEQKKRKIGAILQNYRDKKEIEKDEIPFDLNEHIRHQLMDKLNVVLRFENVSLQGKSYEEEKRILSEKLQGCLATLMEEQKLRLSRSAGQEILRQTLKDVAGLGPIQDLLDNPTVSEVMVNGPKRVYAEIKGKLVLTDSLFKDNAHAHHIIQKIVAPLGRRCDASMPIVDARLRDGSRVNAVIPPVALCGPTITIRKFSKKPLKMEQLVTFDSLSQEMFDFLKAAVLARLNIVVSGGTGSGKTTTLNAISGFIPEDERIITIEDAAELQLQQDHVVPLETRPPNIEGSGAVTIRDLVKNSLRMRPERIIVGECRSGETLDMLQAMNTGHDGSLTTGHANTPKDMVARLETMVMMAGLDLPIRNIREQIASAVHLIVQQNRLKDGSRRITAITEVVGMTGDNVRVENIFEFVQEGVDTRGKVIGHFRATGHLPRWLPQFRSAGLALEDDIFGPGTSLAQIFSDIDNETIAREKRDLQEQLARAATRDSAQEVPAAILKRLEGKPPFKWMDCFPLGLHHVTRRPTSAPHIGGLEGRELEKTIRIRGLIFDLMMDKLAALENQGKKLDIEDERVFVQREAMTLFHEVSRSQGIALSEKAGRAVVNELVNEIAGFGPITPLLYDPQVSEVMVNGPWQIYAEKKGKLTLTDSYFRDDSHAMRIINKIVSPLGRRCDVSSPIVDARLPDGSRVNAAIPPVALCGPTITIRKFSKKPIGMDKLVDFGTLTAEMSAFLHACVLLRLNMVISGGTGSGKTTTLNAISSFIPEDERIITVEDAAELQLQQDHVVGLESRPPNVEGAGAITIRDLVKNTLRMRPERIIVGECRAGETLDMLQAMNTGHDGSLTSGHANTPRDMIARLETMVMMAGMELPSKSIREQIASAVNLIVQQSRLHDGKRKITYISEVAGIDGDEVKLVDLFRFYQHGVDDDGHIFGESRATGNLPSFLLRFKYEKIPLPDGIFGIPKTMDELFAEAEEKRGNDPLG